MSWLHKTMMTIVIPERLWELFVGLVIHLRILPSRGRMVMMSAVSVGFYEVVQELLDAYVILDVFPIFQKALR
jgi:hypothetical protein